MSKYKAGDKVVINITSYEDFGDSKLYGSWAGNAHYWFNERVIDNCAIPLSEYTEKAKAEGHEEAWKLMQKLVNDPKHGGYGCNELEEIFGYRWLDDVLSLTYSEVVEKLAEWERQKEICVGDVVTFYGKCGLVTFIDQQIRGISESGVAFVACKEDCTKTGRHIDVDAWLAQIGGESE